MKFSSPLRCSYQRFLFLDLELHPRHWVCRIGGWGQVHYTRKLCYTERPQSYIRAVYKFKKDINYEEYR